MFFQCRSRKSSVFLYFSASFLPLYIFLSPLSPIIDSSVHPLVASYEYCSIHQPEYSCIEYRGRILGRNPDKSLKSIPPCYSQSPLQLCLEIYIFSNSYSFYSSVIVHCKGKSVGKPDRNPYLLPYGLRNPYKNLKSENSQDYAQNVRS
jgi:hypothetical protein